MAKSRLLGNILPKRKRKNYINVNRSQKWRNKELIARRLNDFSEFCSTMGLKLDEIILSPMLTDNNINTDETKITIIENSKTKEMRIVFECLKAKDKINMSTLKELKTIRMPGLKTVTKLQADLNNFFAIKNEHLTILTTPKSNHFVICS